MNTGGYLLYLWQCFLLIVYGDPVNDNPYVDDDGDDVESVI